jgi:hypothetical protein
VTRRDVFLALIAPVLAWPNEPARLRGKLVNGPALETASGRVVLSGDEPTMLVLNDKRLAGLDYEVVGRSTQPGQFMVDPIHTRAMFVHKGGKRWLVTYWCDVCTIRTYSPGTCVCCQDETQLDLLDPDKVDKS